MFPGQFGNANKCLRLKTSTNVYKGTFTVTGGSNPCNYLIIESTGPFSTNTIEWDKGIGNVQYAIIGGGGGGGTSVTIGQTGGGGSSGAVVVGQSQDPNLNGDLISVGSTSLQQTLVCGAAGANQPAGAGGTSSWNGRSASGGSAGGTNTTAGGSGSGGAASGDRGGDGTTIIIPMVDPTSTAATSSIWRGSSGGISTYYSKWAAGGGGGDLTRRASSGAYTNLGGDYLGGFGMQWPTGGSLFSPASGSYGGGGGGGGYYSTGEFRYGNTGSVGIIVLRTQY